MQVIALTCVALVLPHTLLAATATPQVKMTDVALGNNGTLVGQVVDQQGLGIADAQVVVLQQGRKPVQTVADQAGRFQVAGLSGGATQLVTAGGQGVYRLWAVNTAPPAANRSALVLSSGPVVRGQMHHGLGQWLLPGLAAGGIIAGVAIATSNTDSPASP
ncbi:MAG: carboxypeptidase-like regulatory domain-containing protein [Thermoguttaceae bacterium]